MNIKTNLAQHPCKGKCTDFKSEHCSTCLITSNFATDFLPEDTVVKIHGSDDTIYVFAMHSEINPDYCYIGEPYADCGECILLTDIRHAVAHEIKAKRRVDTPVALFISDINEHYIRALEAQKEVS